MLEFLKECDQFSIYDRARDCEIALSAQNSAVSFAVFFEITFKSIYAYFIHEDRYSKDPSLYELLNNTALISMISKQYGFTEFDTVHKIRQQSNLTKHDTKSKPISDTDKKKYFQCVYHFCSLFYGYQTNKKAPCWNDCEYDKLLRYFNDAKINESRSQEYSERISSLQEELRNAKQSYLSAEAKALALQKRLDEETSRNDSYFSTEHVDDTYTIIPENNTLPSFRLSNNQKKAVECADRFIAVIAGPGSGKTRVLTERIKYFWRVQSS